MNHTNTLPNKVDFTSPWQNEPVEKRIQEISQSTSLRVAYLYDSPDSSTFRYRVYNMVEALRTVPTQHIAASWFCLSEKEQIINILPRLNVLIIARIRYNRTIADIVARARLMNIKILFDCDDLIFDVRYTHLVVSTLDQNTSSEQCWQTFFAYIGSIQATASLCDGGITTNAFLAERMAKIVNGPVHIVPNFLNKLQEELSRKLLDIKSSGSFISKKSITIGYFSGTPTHNLDFAMATPALIELMQQDHNVRLRIVGFMQIGKDLEKFSDRIERIDLQDWLNLQIKIAEVDINIAPLQQNEFTNCKSELKFFEAAAVGTWTCATRNFTFEKSIVNKNIGRLTENSEWLSALKDAVTLTRDKLSYNHQAQLAAAYAYEKYGWDKNISSIILAIS